MRNVNWKIRSTPHLMKFMIIVAIILCTYYMFLNKYDNPSVQIGDLYDRELARCQQLRTKAQEKYPDIIDIEEDSKKKENVNCFRIKTNSLPDISEISPKPGKSIFFHETSCKSYSKGKITITARQACAVESAAKLNPDLDIYLLYSSPGEFVFECDESDLFLQALLSYTNVKILHLDYERYVKDTPVESLYSSGKVEKSEFAVAHASDIIRFLTLWKYGGIYLDTDVIVIKSLKDLKSNFAGIQSEIEVAAGILSFDATGEAHIWVENCLKDLQERFTGYDWSDSSVGVITRLLETICETKDITEMQKKNCEGFTLYPQNMFYEIPYISWTWFFATRHLDHVLNITVNSYVLHMWNKLSKNFKILLSPSATKIPYVHFAQRFCPKVFRACDVIF